jgi:type IV pilus assembly protein PilE
VKSRARGFTLIELLVAIAIVAILATVAVASYQDHIRRSARAEAKAVLMEAAGFMERFYTTNGRYDEDTAGNAVVLPVTQSPKDGAARYNISLAAVAVNATDPAAPNNVFSASGAQNYTLQAIPTGAQAGDVCGTLLLDHIGRKGVTGIGATVADCWQR